MGGPRDVVQGWADPDDDDLLFQIGSDKAMGYKWGDLGALFVYMNPFLLKMRWFQQASSNRYGLTGRWRVRVEAWLDGH